MKIEVLPDADQAARRAAEFVAAEARNAVAARGRCVMGFSGGSTPLVMLRLLAQMNLPWPQVHVMQIDERVAPAGDKQRNLTHLEASLVAQVPMLAPRVHAMPVESADLATAAASYADTLREWAGSPPVLDLVHLGLGADGHTASLVPGDPALDAAGDVSLAGPYQGQRRMTLTYPMIDRARCILWLVTGAGKAAMLARMIATDRTIPAGRVAQDRALLIADAAAASNIDAHR